MEVKKGPQERGVTKRTLEESRQHLHLLKVLGQEFQDLEVELLFAVKIPETEIPRREAKIKRKQELIEYFKGTNAEGVKEDKLKFIRDSLAQEGLFHDALLASYELITTNEFGKHIATYLSKIPDVFQKAISLYPENIELIIQLLREAYTTLTDEADRSDVKSIKNIPQSALKIREAINRVASALRIYFSDANLPTALEKKARLEMLIDISKCLDKDQSEWVIDALADNLKWIIQSEDYLPEFSSEKMLSLLVNKSSLIEPLALPVGSITRSDVESTFVSLVRKQSIQVIRKVLGKFGLPEGMYDEWDLNPEAEEARVPLAFTTSFIRAMEQFEAIQALEKERPGCSRELYKRFGIRWFARYPSDVLIKQYDERDSSDKPYCVLLSAVMDPSGAFMTDNDHDLVYDMYSRLRTLGHSFRIAECDAKQEFLDALKSLDATYGEKQKISFLMIRSHAGRLTIELGKDMEKGDIEYEDLDTENFKAIRPFFIEHAAIILDGCSMGRKRGIAVKMSEILQGIKVMAAKGIRSSLTDIGLGFDEGQLIFRLEYNGGDAPVIYIDGRKRKEPTP